jgi:hypothetical protein
MKETSLSSIQSMGHLESLIYIHLPISIREYLELVEVHRAWQSPHKHYSGAAKPGDKSSSINNRQWNWPRADEMSPPKYTLRLIFVDSGLSSSKFRLKS